MKQKQQKYDTLYRQIESLISDETDEISVLSNVAAAIHSEMNFWWTGFYLVRNGELRLGPFQGTVACMHIQYGRGVCGTAWKKEGTIIVDDVEKFPGHIACSTASRSEIVVPIFDKTENVVGVLDIDSRDLATFDDTDKVSLEKISALLTKTLY